ncbi:MAG: hypothetical protein U0234_04385 [Sandaracinus sp.]
MYERALPLLAALSLGVIGAIARLPATERAQEADTYEDRYYLPTPVWLEVFSLGYREALADLIWIRMLVYYGDELVHRGAERHVFDYADAILALDPDASMVYRWMGTLGVYRATDVTVEDVERTATIMERGAARYPNDGQLAWRTGALLAFELPPFYREDPAAQRRARERAVPYLVRATELGAAPPYAMLTSSSLLLRIGHAEEAATHLEEMYSAVEDPALRAEIAARIESLRSGAFAEAFVEENRRFEERWGREMPYAPAALYDLVGPIPVVDTAAVLRDGFGAHAGSDPLGEP